MRWACKSEICRIFSIAQVPSKTAPLLPRHSIHPPKGKFGNWQFSLALKSQWIKGQGGVGWSKPSLDFHVWWPKFKVLLGVSAKIPSHPILLFLGKSSGVRFNNRKDLFPANALKGCCDYVRIHSSISKSATHFSFKNTALVSSVCWWDQEEYIWEQGLPVPS